MKIFIVWLLSGALAVAASGQTTPADVSVAGVVTDQRGDPVQGATVSLKGRRGAAQTDENGTFHLSVNESVVDLEISAPGFAMKMIHGESDGKRSLDFGKIPLAIQTETAEVTVSVTKAELAQEQVKVEEKQRILGVVPNFLVSYDQNPVPLQAKQKYELAFRTLIDPETIGVDLAWSGFQQGTGGLKAYGAGASGYAKRFGASYSTGSINTMLGSAVLPSLFKQDPRYFYKGTGGVKRRALYAISMSVLCKGDNGHWQYNYSGLFGGLAAGGISNLYYPPASRSGFGLTLENTGIGIGSSAISNLFQEFLLRKLTRSAKQ